MWYYCVDARGKTHSTVNIKSLNKHIIIIIIIIIVIIIIIIPKV